MIQNIILLLFRRLIFIKENIKVPKTILDDIWAETLMKLGNDPEFDNETVLKIKSMVKNGIISSDEIIEIFKG